MFHDGFFYFWCISHSFHCLSTVCVGIEEMLWGVAADADGMDAIHRDFACHVHSACVPQVPMHRIMGMMRHMHHWTTHFAAQTPCSGKNVGLCVGEVE